MSRIEPVSFCLSIGYALIMTEINLQKEDDKETIGIALIGAKGRMGQSLLPAIEAEKQFSIVCGVEKNAEGELSTKHGSLPVSASLKEKQYAVKAAIDFSSPEATLFYMQEASGEIPIWIIGTTGFSAEQEAAIADFAKDRVIVKAGNFSVGINVLLHLLEEAMPMLGLGYDLEITETHHKHKVDSPSGTAAMLLAKAENIRKKLGEKAEAVYGRHGVRRKRQLGEIGMHSLRGGSVIGQHAAMLLGEDDKIVLEHTAFSRRAFSSGVIAALYFALQRLAEKKPGLYAMSDVLALRLSRQHPPGIGA